MPSPNEREPFEDSLELTQLPAGLASLPLELGQTSEAESFERYRHLRELGQGAMGTVALMQDVLLRRKVAYKQIKPEALTHDDVIRQFLGEAQITAQLEHPGIVPVYSLEVAANGQIAYAMKVVEGQTLKDRLQQLRQSVEAQPASWTQALRTLLEDFLKVLDAMAYSHSQGVIHRDLKPSNIMFGLFHEVYLLDWGIAQVVDKSAGVIAEAVEEAPEGARPMTGTPRYMSPEQIKGKNLTPQSDLFTLGLILQEVITLQQAVQARTLQEALVKILKPEQRPIQHVSGLAVPAELQAIVKRATMIKAAERYDSVAELTADLRAFVQDRETLVLPDTPWQGFQRWIRHHSAQAFAAAIGLLLICSLAIGLSLWARERTLEHTRRRQAALETALKQALMSSQRIDSQLGRFEALLEHLASSASEAWLRGQPHGPLPVTTLGSMSPADSTDFSRSYWSGPRTGAERLTVLNPVFISLFARAANAQAVPSQWLKQPQSPLRWGLLTLPQTRSLLYPLSSQALSLLPKLQSSLPAQTASPAWGLPVEANGEQLLPLSMAISSDQRELLGQAALFLESSALSQALQPTSISQLQGYWLLDAQLQRINGEDPATLPAALQAAIQAKGSGFIDADGGLWLYQPLATQGWYLVLKLNFEALLAEVQNG